MPTHPSEIRLLSELRQSIDRIEQQLGRLETEKELAAQRKLIDELESHINAVDSQLGSIRAFWEALKKERGHL